MTNAATREAEARRLSEELRLGEGRDLARRRWVIGLSLLGTAAAQAVALYQTGIVRHLPDPPPRSLFDSDRVDASTYAYRRMHLPDAFLMLLSYAATAALAAAGGRDRARTRLVLPVALGTKAFYDVATTVKLAREEWRENRALCAYCQTATAASLATAAIALPEALRGLRSLAGRMRAAAA